MADTLIDAVNAGLKVIGEGEITAFTDGDILEALLVEEVNERINTLMTEFRPRWALARTSLQLTDDITTEKAAVTNGSDTVTCVDDDGADAQNWANAAVGMFFKVKSDNVAYRITAVDKVSDPHTVTIEGNYTGTTSTAAGYVILQNIYSITDTDFNELVLASYGDAPAWGYHLRQRTAEYEMRIVDINTIYAAAGGNLYLDTSGKPGMMARIESDASNQAQFLMWPYPDDDYLMELWYKKKFSSATAAATNLLDADAPDIAYNYIREGCRARAFTYDRQYTDSTAAEAKSERALNDLKAMENRDYQDDNDVSVQTYRTSPHGMIESRSQIAFDTKSAKR